MPDSSSWPADLDAIFAAPNHHRLSMDNDIVRVLETRIEPGEIVPVHTHEWPATYYFLSWSDFVRRDEHGEIMLDTRASGLVLEPGQAVWSPPLGPHSLENVGDRAIHLISVEVKGAVGEGKGNSEVRVLPEVG